MYDWTLKIEGGTIYRNQKIDSDPVDKDIIIIVLNKNIARF